MTYRVPLVCEVVVMVLIQVEVHLFAYGRLAVLPQEWVWLQGPHIVIQPYPSVSVSQRPQEHQRSVSQAGSPYEGVPGLL